MRNQKLFVCLSASFFLFTLTASVSAQVNQAQTRERIVKESAVKLNPTETTVAADNTSRLENEIVIISEAEPEEVKPLAPQSLSLPNLNQVLMVAIKQRVGAPYRFGSEGPNSFDCSGFVWSVFNQAGINLDRGSARNLWATLEPATKEERTKFGTLVFFNGLGHIGIVADDKGFYHASSSRGVMYSTFDKYWSKRVVGFRRIKLETRLETARAKS